MSASARHRAGDRERQHAQDRLRDAYSQGALTLDEYEDRITRALSVVWTDEIDELVTDLPEPREDDETSPVPRRDRAPSAGGAATTSAEPRETNPRRGVAQTLAAGALAVAALVWLQPWEFDQVALFSSSTIQVAAGEDVRVLSVFGSTEVVVVDGTAVDPGVVAIFGSSECADACLLRGETAADAQVDGLALFGSVEIRTADEAAADA